MACSYGAGNYGMCGRAYDPRLPVRLAQRQDRGDGPGAARRRDVDRRPGVGRGARAAVRRGRRTAAAAPAIEEQIERESHAFFITGRLYDDGIIDPRDTRTVLGIALSAVHSQHRRRPPRLRRLPDVTRRCPLSPSCSSPTAARSRAAIIRTAHALGIATVAVFSDPDADAPSSRSADEAVRLPGAAPADTYLRGDLRSSPRPRATGADAVHPGYGFLSENAAFARGCAGAGLTFVGPRPRRSRRWASKIAAKALMAAAGVPVLPGATVDRRRPTVAAEAAADRLPGAGQGGVRRRRARHADRRRRPASSPRPSRAARREAASAFGDGTVFLERYVVDPRHIEVQIFGDTHGNVVHLFERECSIQRRHQKIIEEAPSPAVDDALRGELVPPRPSPRARRSATSARARSSS